MKTIHASVLGCALSLLCGCATVETRTQAAPELQAYFPLQAGNCWTYATSFQDQAQPDLAVCIQKEEGGYFLDDRPAPSRLRFDAEGLRDGTVRYLLKHPIEPGNKWMSVLDVQTVEHYEILEVGREVRAPAGVYRDCVVVRTEIRVKDGRSLVNRTTYAPQVGIVEIRTALLDGANEIPQASMLLKNFTSRKAAKD